MTEEAHKCSPFLKWAGGKAKLVGKIKEFLPSSPNRYFEPFVGAGAVALNVSAAQTYIGDINSDLVLAWVSVRDDCEALIDETQSLFSGKYNQTDSYYKLREEFNSGAVGIRRAALFIYLNRHGFNGMCRYNRNGGFNIPFGNYKAVGFPEKRIREVSSQIKNWHIARQDFRQVLQVLKPGDVCYCDPPYVKDLKTKKGTGGFSAYAPGDFSWEDHIALAEAASEAAKRGAHVLISNHSTIKTRTLYRKFGAELKLHISVTRTIAADADNRRKASELIAVFKP